MDDTSKEYHVRNAMNQQISDAAGNVFYTYQAHWKIVNRLNRRFRGVKIFQIVLTALSTGGFLASLVSGIPGLSWIGGATAAVSLGLNLYTLSFNISKDIKDHTDAANALWNVRENYKSLLVDFDLMETEVIIKRRDELQAQVNEINQSYPGTDAKSFKEVKRGINDYEFEDGESEKLLHLK